MKVVCTITFGLLVAAATPSAHHSFAAEYDGELPVTISGTVARIDWLNPHIYFDVDVKDAKGGVAQWKIEGYPPNMISAPTRVTNWIASRGATLDINTPSSSSRIAW